MDLKNILNEMTFQLKNNLLDKWYPKVVDNENGGYFTNLSYDFKLEDSQDKMIVTQARNIWTLSKSANFVDTNNYVNYAMHGFDFLQNKMWDKLNGGFYQIRNREGKYTETEGWKNEKRIYGNAYGLFALASLYKISKNQKVLDFAKQIFYWIDTFAHDEKNGGYFQFLTEDCKIFDKESDYVTNANDKMEVGYKDQNSSIHLLEAFTEFYGVYESNLLKERLTEMLLLIRDVITTDKGYLQLFFDQKWNPILFKDQSEEMLKQNYKLDHVSFGHDYETAFLMLEASFKLGIENDLKTLRIAKKMVDHALENGWDYEKSGFFDGGYYFNDNEKCKIIMNTKTWWAQAEALNIYLIMAQIFPNENKYIETFINEWNYIKEFIIDNEYGDWYWGGIDIEPYQKTKPKGRIWKGTYHNGRALMNCITILSNQDFQIYNVSEGYRKNKIEMNGFIDHWKKTAELL
ncbi:MAG: AGE family epimerase/isomerase [Ignavibacteriales bacterium]|nr:AGE family epimerase/isomerase [Ignavibacteriales bacterium]